MAHSLGTPGLGDYSLIFNFLSAATTCFVFLGVHVSFTGRCEEVIDEDQALLPGDQDKLKQLLTTLDRLDDEISQKQVGLCT